MTVGSVNPFKPAQSATVAASTTSASATFTERGDAALVFNNTSDVAFVRTGNGSATATTSDLPVPPGARALVATGPYVDTIAVVLSSGSGNVYVTIGDGTQY